MAFTRFNYDDCRIKKLLEESTGPGRYILNKPGWGNKPCFFNDPQMRMQGWGANLRNVSGGAPIDIESDLFGVNRTLTRDYTRHKNNIGNQVSSNKVNYTTCYKPITDQSRTTHPAFEYRDLEQNHRAILLVDPQKQTQVPFQRNLNTRNLERDNYVTQMPCLHKQNNYPSGTNSVKTLDSSRF